MLPCVTPNLWDESQFSIAPSAIDSLNYSPGSEWTSKQMTGDINSFITEAKSPVIEEGGSEIARPQQRRKEIRCMSHMSQSNRTEKPSQKPQKGKYWITRAVSSLTLHLLHLELFLSPFSLSLSCTQKENTDISVTSPRRASEWSLDTEI